MSDMTNEEAIDLLDNLILMMFEDDYESDYDTALRMAINALKAQSDGDTISRQAAIDALDVGAEVLRRVLDDADIVCAEREKYKWGLGLIESCISDIKELPSAQPETIRCKDCKHHHYDGEDIPYCDRIDYGYGWKDDDYCSMAERRTDE